MKEIYYTYNNEAIASCVILSVLQKIETVDIARSCLILPFLLDDKTVTHLQNNKVTDLCLENLIKEQPRLFTSFNKRYLALLPISINSLIILNQSNQIKIESTISMKNGFLSDNAYIGKRFDEIKKALPTLLMMIEKYTTIQLYQLLKIQL